MGILSNFKNLFRSRPSKSSVPLPPPPEEPAADEIDVPELSTEVLITCLAEDDVPHLLDIREPYEWNQVRMHAAQHIPMNEVPSRLDEIPTDKQIVIFCAHGQRSYGVAHYLIENSFDAVSLAGGITDWAAKGYEVEVGRPA